MSFYQHKSGAAKRREKERKEKAAHMGARTLFDMGLKLGDCIKSHSPEEHVALAAAQIANETDTNDNVDMNEQSLNSTTDENQNTCEPETPELVRGGGIKHESHGFDIGLCPEFPTAIEVEEMVRQGHLPHPKELPCDNSGKRLPTSVLNCKKQNGEYLVRRWLVFSPTKSALYCLPCRLFPGPREPSLRSILASHNGWGVDVKWRKLFDRLPEHECSAAHKKSYLAWRELGRRLETGAGIDTFIEKELLTEVDKWKKILERIIDVVVFLGERGLAFRGSSRRIGDLHNGNFLGLLELLAHYDPLLREHITKVQVSKQKGERLQAHYLSADSQNEFIGNCGDYVRRCTLEELMGAKYFSILVDARPDASHTEQTTFIIRYLARVNETLIIQERFLTFVDCCDKKGVEIANLIIETLNAFDIPISDCRGQGYDNASNMSGKYNGVQKHILTVNPLCLYSLCGCHSLNLCGVDSAECCTAAITFFGMVQTVYNTFSSSPRRWQILLDHIGSSVHGLSGTRWTDRVASVRPFAAHLPGMRSALEKLLTLNLTSKTRSEINGAIIYVSSFICIIMSAIWLKILVAIDQKNQIIQAREATLDIEVKHLKQLVDDLTSLRSLWPSIVREPGLVASAMHVPPEFPSNRKSKRRVFFDEDKDIQCDQDVTIENIDEVEFKRNVFYVIIDSVISGLTTRYVAANKINDLFSFLWRYQELSVEEISNACTRFAQQYKDDVIQMELEEEVLHLKSIHKTNFGEDSLAPHLFLNRITSFKLDEIFTNTSIALRIFCTLPVIVASAERSFSKLKLIKNFMRSTMTQVRLNDVAVLSIESDLTRKVDFSDVVNAFAVKKARKCAL